MGVYRLLCIQGIDGDAMKAKLIESIRAELGKLSAHELEIILDYAKLLDEKRKARAAARRKARKPAGKKAGGR
jgi:hypothetical protein